MCALSRCRFGDTSDVNGRETARFSPREECESQARRHRSQNLTFRPHRCSRSARITSGVSEGFGSEPLFTLARQETLKPMASVDVHHYPDSATSSSRFAAEVKTLNSFASGVRA